MNELSREARRLIDEVAHGDGPSAARRARVKQQLTGRLATAGVVLGAAKLAAAAGGQAGGMAGGLLTTAAVGKVGVSFGSVALWLASGALVGALTITPLVMRSESPPTASVPALADVPVARTPAARVVAPSPSVGALPAEPEAQTAVAEPEYNVERSPSRAIVAAAARGRTGPESPPASARAARNLGAETELLESAQRELAAGRGERALQLLDDHQQRFPSAALSEERTFARVIAFCQLGRSTEARAAAEAFLRAAPRSPLVRRIRNSCAFSREQRK